MSKKQDKLLNNTDFEKILKSVPVDYYQTRTQINLLQRYWHKTKINFAIKLLSKKKFKNCLEVGCASGYMISEIAKKFPAVKFQAIDAYHEAIKHAQNQYPNINFLQAKAEDLPFKANQFDIVLCYETIEHVLDPQKVMAEMKRVLKKEGNLILAMDSGVIAFRIIWFFWEKTFGQAWQGAHLNPYHYKELEQLILRSGLKIHSKYFTHFGLEVVFILEKE